MSWEDIIKISGEVFILGETAKMVQFLSNSMVGSENQTMSAKDVEAALKDIKANILKVREELQ